MRQSWKRRASALIGAWLLAGVSHGEPGDDPVPDRVGYAYAPDSEAFLYREDHFETVKEGRLTTERVVYRTGDGKQLAEKYLNYTGTPYAPRFELRMTVNAYREGLRQGEEGIQVFYRPVGDGQTQSESLGRPDNLVADAGFDRLVADRLEALQAGRAPTFDFLVPGRLTAYPFRVRKVATTRVLDQPALHLRLEPARFWLRWLAEPVEVYYHPDSARLLRYVGPSNLRTPEGDNPRVRVDFPTDAPTGKQPTPQTLATHPFLADPSNKD
ncbi:hypothetical protein [Thiohalorhabdus sp.]|uniref:hypothetical protein n=1 Tax=Thiohalorhabdus sp. TaxID=3094134 RepID=UPI002FC37256